jgi:FAD/FMN-containing dehydrogenase/Fe-S oxidoreductase
MNISRPANNSDLGTADMNLPRPTPAVRHFLDELVAGISGEVRSDDVTRLLYATDASPYEVLPVAVAMPRTTADLQVIARLCNQRGVPLTPRAAGTSLAGQTVGPGLIVDTGRYMTALSDLDVEAGTVTVQPGVVRDNLNKTLHPHGWLFGPDTSTSNRAMIGGMIGNNSCGSYSIRYGTTRDNVDWIDVVLADGSLHRLQQMTREAWQHAAAAGDLFGSILNELEAVVRPHAQAIRDAFPREDIIRRNTGYPLDDLANSWLGHNPDRDPDLARFFCGTEGTLGLMACAGLKLWRTSAHRRVIVSHFQTLEEALQATVAIVPFEPAAVELLDKRILELAALNIEQARNMELLQGEPGALLITEFLDDDEAKLGATIERCITTMEWRNLGYAHPVVTPTQVAQIWELRKAGLGVLMGKPGDVKPVTLVEDTAVAVEDLPAFIRDFQRIMAAHGTNCVYYAHASVGELHMRPEMDLKDRTDIPRAVSIATDVADLVRRYRGALSGEHGDGRLRGPFLERALGSTMVGLFAQTKKAFDPVGIFNPSVIVNPAPFEADWRYHETYRQNDMDTEFRYEVAGGLQRAVERCNGAGVCRRTEGGTMCPSYQVTLEEKESTRGRANLFRHLIQKGPDALYTSEALHDALELCVSCKGCKSDCPANVDMATLKAEFEQGWHDRNGASVSARMIAEVTEATRPFQITPFTAKLFNRMQSSRPFQIFSERVLGVSPRRSLPQLAPRGFHRQWSAGPKPEPCHGEVLLFVDEFTDRYEPELGLHAASVLRAAGWNVLAPPMGPSGRTYFSKGFVREARTCIERNLRRLEPWLDRVDAIVGLEPSAVLTFVDEALDLFHDAELAELAARVAAKVQLVDDFIADAYDRGRLSLEVARTDRRFMVHAHCHQKALVGSGGTRRMLELLGQVEVLPTGCCGMAGSFGYKAGTHDISMQMGELVLFPRVRDRAPETIVVAGGTSCRHQIADGTAVAAVHPITAFYNATVGA